LKETRQIRFSMRRLMLTITAVCLLLGTGVWWFFGPALLVAFVGVLLQLPLMLLVKRKLDAAAAEEGDDELR
jgi:hypothetical protein